MSRQYWENVSTLPQCVNPACGKLIDTLTATPLRVYRDENRHELVCNLDCLVAAAYSLSRRKAV